MGTAASLYTNSQKQEVVNELRVQLEELQKEDVPQGEIARLLRCTYMKQMILISSLPENQKRIKTKRNRSFERRCDSLLAAQNVDLWDSVKSQPICELCDMVFATAAKLQNHINYSEIHKKVMEKLLPQSQSSTCPTAVAHKLLYRGNKFFWRIKQHVDVSIFDHLQYDVLEVIGFNVDVGEEYARIYLRSSELKALAEAARCLKTCTDLGLPHSPSRSPQRTDGILKSSQSAIVVGPIDPSTLEVAERELVASYILTRLQVNHEGAEELLLMPVSGDIREKLETVMCEKPEALGPAQIQRRRRTTGQDFRQSQASFVVESEAMRNDLREAHRLWATAIDAAFTLGHQVLPKVRHQSLPLSVRSPKSKWVLAAHRARLEADVERTREMLASLQRAQDEAEAVLRNVTNS